MSVQRLIAYGVVLSLLAVVAMSGWAHGAPADQRGKPSNPPPRTISPPPKRSGSLDRPRSPARGPQPPSDKDRPLTKRNPKQTTKRPNRAGIPQQPELRGRPPIYVLVIMHNESPHSPNYHDFSLPQYENEFWQHRNAVLHFANMLKANGAKLNFQSDWSFLKAVNAYDTGTIGSDGKNLIRFLKENLEFEVDPHTHPGQDNYNLADVAHLISQTGVDCSGTVGGFVAWPAADSLLERYWLPVGGGVYQTKWKADILWGAATLDHENESQFHRSGIWKPASKAMPLTHDANSPLPLVGNYGITHNRQALWAPLRHIIWEQQHNKLKPKRMYTCSIFVGQHWLIQDETFIDEFQAALQQVTPTGNLRWVGISEAVEIWRTRYAASPNIARIPTETPQPLGLPDHRTVR